jgi:hypothetical protein
MLAAAWTSRLGELLALQLDLLFVVNEKAWERWFQEQRGQTSTT